MVFTALYKEHRSRFFRYAEAALLPGVLVAVFVIQNAAFNAWCNILPDQHFRMYIASLALGVLLFGPALFLKPRWRHLYLAVIAIATSTLFIAEYLYYSYSGGFLQVSAIKMVRETGAVTGTVVRLITPRIVLFAAGPLLVLVTSIFSRVRNYLPIALTVPEKMATIALIVLTTFGGYGTLFAAEKREYGDSSRLYKQLYDLNTVVGKMGIANYFLEDAVKRAIVGGSVSEQDRAFVRQWNGERATSTTDGSTFGIAKGRNLIFIQVESLENAVINQQMGGADITPNLNALAREGLYYSNYFAQDGIGNTADAEFTTLNSLYPLPDSVAFLDHAQNQYAALPKLLDTNGYHTAVLHGDVATFWNRAVMYPNLGYQTTFSKDSYTPTRNIGITGLGDEDFLQQSLPKIQGLSQPFMATLITLSSHTPFTLPEDLRTLPIPANSGLNDTQTQYLESVHYTDRAIGEFIDELKRSNLYNNSVIVIFGDHGSFTDISKVVGSESGDVAGINAMQVPLIILAPGTGLAGEQKIPASHLDLYPTVAHLLGIETPASVLGQDLLSTKTPIVVQRKSETGGISAIMSSQQIYIAADDGEFEDGRCLTADTHAPLAISACKAMYDEESTITRVSDTVVRGDMVGELDSGK